MRAPVPFLLFLVAALTAAGIYMLSFSYFRSEEVAAAKGRLSLYRSTVVAELDRFSHLTYVLAQDPIVIETAEGGAPAVLDLRLAAFAAESGLDAIYLMDLSGETISASNAGTSQSFVGQNYGFRPYFSRALAGEQGRFYGIGATTGLPGYFIAGPVPGTDGPVGVIAIKLDLTKLEESWREAGERVFLANQDGVILLASAPDLRYLTLAPIDEEQRARIEASRQFPGQDLAPLDWQAGEGDRAELQGSPLIHQTSVDMPHDWVLHYFADTGRAAARSGLVTVGAVGLFGLWFLLNQRRRNRAMGVALRKSVAEEAQLRQANERLAHEIDERRTAERRLKRTQGELERAGRLAALGQLAASVTHELGQPIAAMKNHLAAAEIGGKPAAPQITGLVDRMEEITRQLKFFARKGGEPFGPVSLSGAVEAALSLVETNLRDSEVTATLSGGDVMLHCNKLRLEQVLINLLRNAVDAMEDAPVRELHIAMGEEGPLGWIEIADTGHGLGTSSLQELQEPFVTTRESGRGMGLGLAISASIVAEHGGRIEARERDGGGAVFRVEIPLATASQEAAE